MNKEAKITKQEAAILARKIIDNGDKYHLPTRKLKGKKK